jgi:two-component system sensor histidine kinase BarA
MAKPPQSSFRRILVSKILLLSVPVLLIGEIIVYNKARSSLLETARQNLTESAIIKGEKIADTISALKANLVSASQTIIVKSGSPNKAQEFIAQLAHHLSKQIDCIQLTDPESGKVVASTCGEQLINELKSPVPRYGISVEAILPPKIGKTGVRPTRNQLQLLFSAPVYDVIERLKYILNFQSSLWQDKLKNKPGSLTGSTVVIADDGTILAHPIASRINTNIREHVDASRLSKIVENALAGKQDSLDFFSEEEGQELLAGYTTIESPLTQGEQRKWVIIAVTSLENALYGLETIKLILIFLTVCLIGGSLLASLYVARYIARPVEQLRDYALNLHLSQASEPVSHNFKIKEFNQLAQAVEQMVERLKAWAEELELAWKEAKAANQIKTQFLATTSHELRNPLNIIINSVRLVKEGMCDNREEEIEFLERADQTAIHLLGIINDLLDISKIEAGKLSVSLEPTDLRQILKEVINLQSVNVQQKGLKLNISQMNEIMSVNADGGKLKQVLINVIGNAIKFTEQGSITITTEIQHSNGIVTVSVKDTGIGIDPTQQEKLFRPFVRVDDKSTRKFGGTGLGLAISRNLIELMGGSISLQSAGINQGTTVTITLPLIDSSKVPSVEGQGNLRDRKMPCGEQAVNGKREAPNPEKDVKAYRGKQTENHTVPTAYNSHLVENSFSGLTAVSGSSFTKE